MSAEWDKTKSYSLNESVYYNGYRYIYINKDNPSNVGSPPNEETFNLTYKDESRYVRSWTLFEYVIPSSPAVYLPGGHFQIRELDKDPGIANGNAILSPKRPQPRFEYLPTINPWKAKDGTSIEEIGNGPRAYVSPPYTPDQLLEKYFEQGVYVDDGTGFNAEYKSTYSNGSSSTWSYNLTEYGYLSGLPDGQQIHITMGYKIVKETSTKAVLYVYAYPLKDSVVLQAPDLTNSLFMALFNCFGKKFKFRFVRTFTDIDGITVYGPPEEGEVSSGEFHDGFSEENMQHGVKFESPIIEPYVDASFLLSSDPSIGFIQQVEMIDRYEDQ